MGLNSGKRKILIMDDEKAIRDLILLALSTSGFEVCPSNDGTEALELYESAKRSGQPFDAIILDLSIKSGMDGIETIGRVTAIDPEVKAIVCSGSLNHPAMGDHRSYGFKGIVRKPFSFRELKMELDKVLESNQL